jgi:hypothetical protein
VSGTGQEDHIEIVFFDQAVEVNVGKCEARTRPPVSEEPVFDVLRPKRFFE